MDADHVIVSDVFAVVIGWDDRGTRHAARCGAGNLRERLKAARSTLSQRWTRAPGVI